MGTTVLVSPLRSKPRNENENRIIWLLFLFYFRHRIRFHRERDRPAGSLMSVLQTNETLGKKIEMHAGSADGRKLSTPTPGSSRFARCAAEEMFHSHISISSPFIQCALSRFALKVRCSDLVGRTPHKRNLFRFCLSVRAD